MFVPQDVGGSYGFWFEMHVILLVRVQDCVVKQITSWSVCLSPWLHSCLWTVVKVMRPVVGGEKMMGVLFPLGGPFIQCTINRAASNCIGLLSLLNFN